MSSSMRLNWESILLSLLDQVLRYVLYKVYIRKEFGEPYRFLNCEIPEAGCENMFHLTFLFCSLGGDFLEYILKIIHIPWLICNICHRNGKREWKCVFMYLTFKNKSRELKKKRKIRKTGGYLWWIQKDKARFPRRGQGLCLKITWQESTR